jgi:hypothetical protein
MKLKEKHNFIRPLRKAGFSRAEVNELGFNCGKLMWTKCLNERKRNLGGRPHIPEERSLAIKNHLESISHEASNRILKKFVYTDYIPNENETEMKKKEIKARRIRERKIETVKYLNNSKIAAKFLFDRLPGRENEKKIPYSTFLKYIDKKYKKVRRLTDLCILKKK